MRYQLREDRYGGRTRPVFTEKQREFIRRIKRPQLQEDIYSSIRSHYLRINSQNKIKRPSREID